MDNPEEQSKYVWKWTQWSSVCVGLGVAIFFLVLTAGGPWLLGLVLGAVVAAGGGVAFGFVPRNPPKPGIHGSGPMPGRARRKGASHPGNGERKPRR